MNTTTNSTNNTVLNKAQIIDMMDAMKQMIDTSKQTVAKALMTKDYYDRLVRYIPKHETKGNIYSGMMSALSGVPLYIDDGLPQGTYARFLNADGELLHEIKKAP